MIGLQLLRHSFWQWESFRGLVDTQHPKDVPFVREYWLETYGLGAISPRKKQISVIAAVDVFLNYDAKVSKPMWAWYASVNK